MFVFGFAYGTEYKLEGKKLLLSFTTGASEDTYQKGEKSYSFSDLLHIHKQTANFTKMDFVEPVISYGMRYIPDMMSIDDLTEMEERLRTHAERLVAQIKSL